MWTLQLQDHAQLPERVEPFVGEHLHEQVAPDHHISLTHKSAFIFVAKDTFLHEVLEDGGGVDLPGQGDLVPVQKSGYSFGACHFDLSSSLLTHSHTPIIQNTLSLQSITTLNPVSHPNESSSFSKLIRDRYTDTERLSTDS